MEDEYVCPACSIEGNNGPHQMEPATYKHEEDEIFYAYIEDQFVYQCSNCGLIIKILAF